MEPWGTPVTIGRVSDLVSFTSTNCCSGSEMFTVNRVADCEAVIRNLVHRFMMRLTISKHLIVCSILPSDLVCSSRIRRHCMSTIMVDDKSAVPHHYRQA